jgi:hypothetical protein
MIDRRKTTEQLAIGVGISTWNISQILHTELGMPRVSARCVFRFMKLSVIWGKLKYTVVEHPLL